MVSLCVGSRRNLFVQVVCIMRRYVTGIVGEVDGEEVFIWTHKKFDIGYNGKNIVDVNLTSETKVKLQPNVQLKFTYEVFERQIEVPCRNS